MNKNSVNKIYGSFEVKDIGIRSRARMNHDSLISTTVADELNAYRTWNSFNLAADVDYLKESDFKTHVDKKGNVQIWEADNKPMVTLKTPKERVEGTAEDKEKNTISSPGGVQSTGVRSIFNRLHAVGLQDDKYAVRISQNDPLIDSPKTRALQRSMNACTVKDLVEKSHRGLLGMSVYDYSDFMFCKYLGRISNNYLITLRRYAFPVLDYVRPYGNASAINGVSGTGTSKVTTKSDIGGIPLGTMVTWLGTPGNEMNQILKYSFSMPFKDTKSQFEEDGSSGGQSVNNSSHGIIGAGFSAMTATPVSRRIANFIMPGAWNPRGGRDITYPGPHYDTNKAYSGIDMIKHIMTRDAEEGLKFDHKFKLTFDYELRSYDGVNGKQAMLDLLGNILTVCYTTGDFWPGAYKHTAGGASYQPTSSLEIMKHHNTFSEYINAFSKDFSKLRGNLINILKDPIGSFAKLMNGGLGALLGGDMDTVPPAMKSGVNSLLVDAAVGLWHVTIGNPCAPIMSIGNLVMSNCTVEHYGPLGIDDFPTGLRVECEFEHGKRRDKRLIERMYNSGNDRIYVPLDQSVFNIYNKSKKVGKKGVTIQSNVIDNSGKDAKKDLASRNAEMAAYSDAINKSLSESNPEHVGGKNRQVVATSSLDNVSGEDLLTRVFGLHGYGDARERCLRMAAGELAEGAPVVPLKDVETAKSNS